jgi:hypothetical protein
MSVGDRAARARQERGTHPVGDLAKPEIKARGLDLGIAASACLP